ncbi:uncharacterized protein LOC131885133 [Tigriopus californicus]|uniref:uncharacterized protein LOC131885133 n=1 Tax=Tigriopus californicus TaxID=6832 RepID=UPI0027DA3632|nr:uncharacterized protein LOC131885133 [Tigriopus californicus]|eukprot:TCALIF_11576-PA protein Name:"Similar to Squidulin (Doryteuthis pealeii)" AED:0.26 eAED:0.26 QI:0/0/0/0.5/1/1/2/0/156
MFVKEIIDAFNVFDTNKDGRISLTEFRNVIAEWEADPDHKHGKGFNIKSELEAVLKKCTTDPSGSIDLNEFRNLWEYLRAQIEDEEIQEILDEFRRYDKDNDGSITRSEMEATIQACSSIRGAKSEEARKCLNELDMDGNGRISFPEFLIAYKFKA